ncbi:hypothetical protein ACIRBX_00595 [Kitasatospora sp. NPDC096147]|uniref:hypothetical protein n=1 Tax=Kitasatospora sp. NPDC096147 TaxID=3364093 RepID=UPI0037F7410C
MATLPAWTAGGPTVPALPLEETMSDEEPARRVAQTATKRLAATQAVEGGGSAGAGFEVDPEKYRAAVSPMLAAAEQVRALYTSLSAFLPSAEADNPWGNDDAGKKFAEGDEGYLKFSSSTMEVLKGLPDALKGVADGMKAMAEGYASSEDAIIDAFGSLDAVEIAIPQAPNLPGTAPDNPVHIPVTPRTMQSGRH